MNAQTSLLIQTPSLLQSKPSLKPSISILHRHHRQHQWLHKRKVRDGICRAELLSASDASIGVAIGGCILNSLIFPTPASPEDEEGDSVIDSDDARFAVMGIISLIPYFNWLSWLFAWLDTGKQRYAVYAIVYLAPYLRPNLSISPDDSWLPIASILLCIIHIQLEASIRNGDIEGLQMFSEFGKRLSSKARKDDIISNEKTLTADRHKKLPSTHKKSRHFIRDWGVPRKPFQGPKSLNFEEDEELDEEKKQ